MYLLATLACGFQLDCSHDDSLIPTAALLLYHLAFGAELLQYAFGVAAPVGVGVVVTHAGCWFC